MHYRTRYKSDLSPRQREVLELVAKGYTNGQIAERLGLTLDGAKWHVSEILSKLDMDTREEAGRYWRAEHSLPRRLARAMPGFGWLGLRPLLIAAGAAAAVVAGVAIYVAIQATDAGRQAADAVPTTQATAPATATPPPFDYGTAATNPSFGSVRMFADGIGWATGQSPASVLRTADGGGHWRNVSPPGVASASGAADSPAASITGAFLNANDAWAAIWTPPTAGTGQRGGQEIWLTTDGGHTWEQSASSAIPGGPGGWFAFVSPSAGWFLAAGEPGAGQEQVTVYRTLDGGLHWVPYALRSSPEGTLPRSCIKSGITFQDQKHGWVTAQCAGGTPFFYGTTDAGATWAPVSLPSPDDAASPLGDCQCGFQPPQFIDSHVGFLPVAIPDQHGGVEHYIYTTDDGGVTWHASAPAPIQNALPAFAFADATHWFAATNGGNTLYGTSDGGKTWSVIANPPQFGDGVNSLQFTDAQHGWAVLAASGPQGEGSKLLQTSDGGKTWVVLSQ